MRLSASLLNAKSILSVDPTLGSVGGIALANSRQARHRRPGEAENPNGCRTGVLVQGLGSPPKAKAEIALGPYLSDMRNPGLDAL